MSYAVGFHIVKNVESVEDAIVKINNFFETINKEEYIDNFLNYLSYLFFDNKIKKIDYFDKKVQEIIEEFVTNISRFKFIYWKEQKMLGLASLNYSWKYSNINFVRYVEFQNSTDNDYNLKTWENLSPNINSIVEHFKKMSNEELIKQFEEKYDSSYDKKDNADLEYYRKTFIYDAIEKKLDIMNYLYNKKSDKFTILNMFYDYKKDHDLKIIAFKKIKEYLLSEFPNHFTE